MKKYSARVSVDGSNQTLDLVDKASGEVLEKLPIRTPLESDKSFVLSTWIRSYAPVVRRMRLAIGTAVAIGLGQEVYLAEEPRIAEFLWNKGLVVGADDGFTIYAWICGEKGKLYHIYVVPELRDKGVAGALIKHLCGPIVECARPWPYERFINGCKMVYNPYLLRK